MSSTKKHKKKTKFAKFGCFFGKPSDKKRSKIPPYEILVNDWIRIIMAIVNLPPSSGTLPEIKPYDQGLITIGFL